MSRLGMVQGGRQLGFSLLELVVVLGILGALAAAVLPVMELNQQRQREAELRAALREIRAAIDEHAQAVREGVVAPGPSGSRYPENLDALVQGKPDLKQGGAIRYFLRRIPRDPFAPETLPANQSWGLRSYQSSAEKPMPGVDVFDIYSLSDRVGLNGQPLSQW